MPVQGSAIFTKSGAARATSLGATTGPQPAAPGATVHAEACSEARMRHDVGMARSTFWGLRVDRSVLTVSTLRAADAEDYVYWHTRTPRERLAAMEIMRQAMIGYEAASARFPRFLEVVKPQAR